MYYKYEYKEEKEKTKKLHPAQCTRFQVLIRLILLLIGERRRKTFNALVFRIIYT